MTFKKVNHTEIARKRLEIREKLQRNVIMNRVGIEESVMKFDLAHPLAAVSRSRDFQQLMKLK